MRHSLWQSVFALFRGIVARFLFWLPLILLDATDYWDRYVRPGIRYFAGRDPVMPEGTLLVGAVIGFVWSAVLTYHELRGQKLAIEAELVPTVHIDPTPILQAGFSGYKPNRSFYITVSNPSARPLRRVCVNLTDINPPVASLSWLPIPLHIKHDNLEPYRETFDMNPQGVRHIDIVSHVIDQPDFAIEHIVRGVGKAVPIGAYTLTIRAEGADIAYPQEAKFFVKLDGSGHLVCLAASLLNDEKGLIDFRHDAVAAMNALLPAITAVTRDTDEVGQVAQRITEVLNKLTSDPIRWHERLIGIHDQAERVHRRSFRITRQLDRVVSRLKCSVDNYSFRASEVIQNYAGYVELADTITTEDLQAIRRLRESADGSLCQIRQYRAVVMNNEQKRTSTAVTRSMKSLGTVIDRQIETTESIAEAFDMVIGLAERKSDSGKADHAEA